MLLPVFPEPPSLKRQFAVVVPNEPLKVKSELKLKVPKIDVSLRSAHYESDRIHLF